MRPRSRTITRRAMLTTVLMGATAALLTEATRPALALTPGAAAPPVEAPKQMTPYEVTFLTTQTNPADVKIYEDLAAAFNGTVPGVTVKITSESGTNIDQKLLTYLTAGTLPDIVQTNDNFAKPYKDNGITQNMIPFAEKTGFPWQDFDPTFLNLGIVDGELHMLPKQGDIILPYVNLRMAQEAGVTPPVDFDPATDSERLDLGRVRDDVQADDRRRERRARRRVRLRQGERRGLRRGLERRSVVRLRADGAGRGRLVRLGRPVAGRRSTRPPAIAAFRQADPADHRRLLGAADADPDDEQPVRQHLRLRSGRDVRCSSGSGSRPSARVCCRKATTSTSCTSRRAPRSGSPAWAPSGSRSPRPPRTRTRPGASSSSCTARRAPGSSPRRTRPCRR